MRAVVAMSGGVDSAAAALLLREQGFDVQAVTLELCGPSEATSAAGLCGRIGIPHHVLDVRKQFEAAVIAPFCAAWQRGLTPNPCVLCNRAIKFGALMDWALGRADCFATGHYARVEEQGGHLRLMKALDGKKDQSYVLHALTAQQLEHIRLPLGRLTKVESRAVCAGYGLDFAGRPESQDICFIPDGNHAGFIEGRTGAPALPGDFALEDGTVVGRHRGLLHYTVGQRKGLGLAWAHPLFVLRKERDTNRVVVGAYAQSLRDTIAVAAVHWIDGPPPGPVAASVRTRYHQREVPATVTPEGGGARVRFNAPVPAPAPGQAAVFYAGDCVLGGGTIL